MCDTRASELSDPHHIRVIRLGLATNSATKENQMSTKGYASLQATDPTTLIPELRAVLAGRVITPDDAEYDRARTLFYRGIDRRPAFIVKVANAADVLYVVSLARDAEIELAVRSGGHSFAGHSVSEGG